MFNNQGPFIFIVLMSISLAKPSFSQDSSPVRNFNKKSWEVALDLLPLIDKQKSDYNFLLRRNYGNKALRFKLLFDGSSDRNSMGNKNFQRNTLGLGFFLGHEWQKHITNNFIVYYGADFGYTSTQNKDNALDDPNGSNFYSVIYSKIIHLRLNPFFGSKYYFTRNLSTSIESTLDTDWYQGRVKTERYQSASIITDQDLFLSKTAGKTNWYKRYQFIPLYKIYLSYHF